MMTMLSNLINDLFSTSRPAQSAGRRFRIDTPHEFAVTAAQELNDSIHLWSAREASQVEIHHYASADELGQLLDRFDKSNGQGIADVVLLLDESLPVQFEHLLHRQNPGRRLTLIPRQASATEVCYPQGLTSSHFRLDWEAVEVNHYLKDALNSSMLRLNSREKLAVLLPANESFAELIRNRERVM
ncbi:hypothetical protein [Gimesia panareensis]|nr:hypothetical protein [Gimesia panareensis]